jgi:hypothetical protein
VEEACSFVRNGVFQERIVTKGRIRMACWRDELASDIVGDVVKGGA